MIYLNDLKDQLRKIKSIDPSLRNRIDEVNLTSAIRWMEEGSLTEIEQVGPFGELGIKPGQKVTIRKGAKIRSTNPKYACGKTAGRQLTINVMDVEQGFIATSWHPHQRCYYDTHREETVRWVGAGGYFYWTETSNLI